MAIVITMTVAVIMAIIVITIMVVAKLYGEENLQRLPRQKYIY